MARSPWLVLFIAACGSDGRPSRLIVELDNPTALRFEGSGGALGLGLEFRVGNLEAGRELVVDPNCADGDKPQARGRSCGNPATTEASRCERLPERVDPGSILPANWDGRYFPRMNDPFGDCLGASRQLDDEVIRVTVCGRLVGDEVREARLLCVESDALLGADSDPPVHRIVVPGGEAVP